MSDNLANNKLIAKNTIFLYLRMAIVLVVSLYTTRVVLQSLGVEDYGIYNVVCGFVSMFSFLNSTLSSSINRFFNYEIGQGSNNGVTKVYNSALRIQGGLALALFVVVEAVGVWYINSKMVIPDDRMVVANWIFHFAVISMTFTILQAPYIAAILAYEKMNYYAIVSIIDVFLKLTIAVVIQSSSFDKLLLYGLLIMLISFVDLLLYYVYAGAKFKELKLQRGVDRTQFRSMLSFSGWSLLNPLAYTGRSQGCNLVLNYFFGPIVNAAYAIANQVSSAIDSFSSSISVASRPQLIQSYSSGDYDRSKILFFSTSKMMFLLISMLIVPLSFNMDYVLNLWLGETVPDYTTTFCVWILYVKLIDTLNPSVTNLIMATGRIKAYMVASCVCIFAVIPVSIFVFNVNENPVLLFICMFICTLLNQIFSIIILNKVFTSISLKTYFYDIVLRCMIYLVLICTPCFIFRSFSAIMPSGITSILFDFILVVLVGMLSAYFIVLDHSEKTFVKRMLKRQ